MVVKHCVHKNPTLWSLDDSPATLQAMIWKCSRNLAGVDPEEGRDEVAGQAAERVPQIRHDIDSLLVAISAMTCYEIKKKQNRRFILEKKLVKFNTSKNKKNFDYNSRQLKTLLFLFFKTQLIVARPI